MSESPVPFDRCVTVSTTGDFDATWLAPWKIALPGSWSMTVLPEGQHGVRHALGALRLLTKGRLSGRTLAILPADACSLATSWPRACSTLTLPSARPLSTILVAVGRPRLRSQTLLVAAAIAARTGASLVGVHSVVSKEDGLSTADVIAANARVTALGSARVRMEDVRIELSTSPVEAIQRVAHEINADVVVVGRASARVGVASTLSRSGSFSTLAVV